MRKWIWTFGVGSPYKGKYVVIETDNGDGREYMFNKYGKQNCCMSYLYAKGMELVKKYGYTLIENVKIRTAVQFNDFISVYIIHKSYFDDFYTANIFCSNECMLKHDESYELMEGKDENNSNKQ